MLAAPTDLLLDWSVISESQPIGTPFGTLAAVDADVGDIHTYALVAGAGDTDNARFAIEANILKTNAPVDYEAQATYSIRVQTTDALGGSFAESFTITVGDAAEPAATERFDWITQFSGIIPSASAEGDAVVADANGHLYVAGCVDAALPGQVHVGGYDTYLRKYDTSGRVLWTRQFGSAADDFAADVAVDATGIYLAGHTDGALPGQTSAGASDAFVRKYDGDGMELWTRQFGSTATDYAEGLALDTTGVYLTGTTYDVLPGQTGAGNLDAFVRKYDDAGNELWTRQFGSAVDDFASGVAADVMGVYLAGYTAGALPGEMQVGAQDAFLRKYDADGNEGWTHQFGTTSTDYASAVAVDATGVYLAGNTYGWMGDTPPGFLTASCDGFVRKYSAAGDVVWTRQLGTLGSDSIWALAVDSVGVYLAGSTSGTLRGQTNAGSTDAVVWRIDHAGGERLYQFGSPVADVAYGIAVAPSVLYAVGGTEGGMPGLAWSEGYDAFLARLKVNLVLTNVLLDWSIISENQPAGAPVGSFTAVDPDGGDTFGYALVAGEGDGDNARFTIDGTVLKTAAVFDYEAQASYSIRVQATDADGHSYAKSFTIAVADAAEPAATERFDWVTQFGGVSYSAEDALCVARDLDGNVYVAGNSDAVLPDEVNSTTGPLLLRKYDATGNLLWSRRFATLGSGTAYAVAADSSGVYVAGTAFSSIYGDAFVQKFSADGGYLWYQQFGTAAPDVAYALAVDVSGVYVAGSTQGVLPGQTGLGGSGDAFLRKYDLSGSELWTRQFGTSGSDVARAIIADGSSVYVAGETDGTFSGQTRVGGIDAFLQVFDPAGTTLWTRQFGTTSGDWGRAVTADATGIYVAGETYGQFTGQTGGGGYDAYVRKYDTAGNVLWTSQFGAAQYDYAYALAADGSNVYVAGYTTGTLPGQSSQGSDDAFVRKYSTAGAVLWTSQFGTSYGDRGYALAADTAGVYAAGYTYGTFPGQIGSGSRGDAFLRKYNPWGDDLWTRQFYGDARTDQEQTANAVAVGDGCLYVVGGLQDALPGQTSSGNMDAFVRKYDAAGRVLWTSQFGTSSYDEAYAVAVDATGVYVAGYAGGTLPGQIGLGGYDAFVRKYSLDGVVLWTRQFGSVSADYARGIAVDETGAYVTGETGDVLPGQTRVGASDVFLVKYDADGNELWTRQYGSSGDDYGQGVAVGAGGVYVAGRTNGALAGQAAAGGLDVFLRKHDLDGAVLWTRQFGSAIDDYGQGVGVDANGIYVGGYTSGALPGQASAGSSDAFARKYDDDGNELWTRQFGSTSDDQVFAVAVDADAVYLTGRTFGVLPGQSSAGNSDAFVWRLDSAGGERWYQFGSAGYDEAYGIVAAGDVTYVVGTTPGGMPGLAMPADYDAFVAGLRDNVAPSELVLTAPPISENQPAGTPVGSFTAVDPDGGDTLTYALVAGSGDNDNAQFMIDGTVLKTAAVFDFETRASYSIRVGATDADGYSHTKSFTITVADAAEPAATERFEWVTQFGETTYSTDEARGVAVDAAGNTYVVGATDVMLPGQIPAGEKDVYLSKFDLSGYVLWTRQFGSTSDDYGYSVAVDAGGVYVAGYTKGTLPGQNRIGNDDLFLCKYDTDGNELWIRQFGTSANDWGGALVTDSTGVYLAGATFGALPGQTSLGNGDAFVRKYDAAGTELWTRQFGTTSPDSAYALALHESGVYVAGSTLGTLPGQSNAGNGDAFARKYDRDGATLWTRQFGTTYVDQGYAAAADASGVYVAGSSGQAPGASGPTGEDGMIWKVDGSGNLLWSRQIISSSTSLDRACAVVAHAGGIYVAGYTGDALPGQTEFGGYDAFVRKYDAAGGELWTRQFGTTGSEYLYAACAAADGIWLAGSTTGPLVAAGPASGIDGFLQRIDTSGQAVWTRQFFANHCAALDQRARAVATFDGCLYVVGDVEGVLVGALSGGDNDAFVRKYDAAGGVLWTRQFGSLAADFDYARAVAVDATGVYVTGDVGGTLAGESDAGASDAFVRRYDHAGNELWTRQFGSTGNDYGYSIAVDGGSVYVAGYSEGALAGQTAVGDTDAFLRKYDLAGNELWTRQFGTTASDLGRAVAVDATGVYVGGITRGALGGQGSFGETDAFVCKYDAEGNELWTRQFGSSSDDFAEALVVHGSGVSVAGYTYGALPGQASAGSIDAFARTYDADGNERWIRQFGSTNSDYGYALSADSTGVYLAGSTSGTLRGQTSAGGTDAFVWRIDDAGSERWFQFGSPATDQAYGIAVDDSALYVVGRTQGAMPGLVWAGDDDAFVAELRTNLTPTDIRLDWPTISENQPAGTPFGSLSGVDPDGGETYEFTLVSGPDDNDNACFSIDGYALKTAATFDYEAQASYSIRVLATDSFGESVGRSFTIAVADAVEALPDERFDWQTQFGATSYASDEARSTACDADGSVYLVGTTDAALPGQVRTGGKDVYVRKYDAAGNELWTRQFGSTADDYGYAVAVDATAVYVTGYVIGTLPGQISAGAYDAFIRKYDLSGGELWTRQFGSTNVDRGYAVAVDATGVYIAGTVGGALPGQTPLGQYDVFVRKFDLSGMELWTRQFGSTSADYGYAVLADASGVYLAGFVGGALPEQAASGSQDAFVRKYDAAGNELWTRQFGTTASDYAYALASDATGVYVAGAVGGTLPGQTRVGGADAFVRKYDPFGGELWTRQFGSTASDYAYGLAVDAAGVYVAGNIGGTLPGQTAAGNTDAFLRKYDTAGNERWTRQFGTLAADYAYALATSAAGVYVAGLTNGTLTGPTNPGTTDAFLRAFAATGNETWTRQFCADQPTDLTQTAQAVATAGDDSYVVGAATGALPGQASAGSSDVFLRKYGPAGNELWTRQFGTASSDYGYAVAVDGSGIYVTGYVGDTLAGQSSAGSYDAFLRRYDLAGNEVWTRQFGTTGVDYGRAIAVDNTGIYVTGYVGGALHGQTSFGDDDAFVRKYDLWGTELWTQQFGTAADDEGYAVAVDPTGVYVSGRTADALPGQASLGSYDAFLRKYDLAGGEQWIRQFGSPEADLGAAVAVDATGVYVGGHVNGAIGSQPSAGGYDAFVRKYDASGTELWTSQFGSPSSDYVRGLTTDDGGVYLAGYTSGTLPGQTSAGGYDVFVRRYSQSGYQSWTSQFGTAGADYGRGIVAANGAAYVVGEAGGGLPRLAGAGDADAFVTRLDANLPPLPWGTLYYACGEDDASWHANLLAGASDPDLDVLAVANLSLSGYTAGTTPAGNLVRVDPAYYQFLHDGQHTWVTARYDVVDGQGGWFFQTTYISIFGANDAPTVSGTPMYAAGEDDGAFYASLLAGASDVDNNTQFSVSNLQVVSGDGSGISLSGTHLFVNPAAYNYLAAGQWMSVEFGYDIHDGYGGSVHQTAWVTLFGANDSPQAVADAATVALDGSVVVAVLANDTDPDHLPGQPANTGLQVVGVVQPASGSVVLNSDGTVTYTPLATLEAATSDSFSYTVQDTAGVTALATVNVQLTDAVAAGTIARTGNTVRVGGTESADTFNFTNSGGTLFRNGRTTGVSLAGATEIHVYARGGNDRVDVSRLGLASFVHGGAGNDTLLGGSARNILFGDAGDDRLTGGATGDVLIGGPGADTLGGGAGHDILFAGDLDFRATRLELEAMLAAWIAEQTSRPATDLLQTAVSDGFLDTLTGGAGNDRFHAASVDRLTDRRS